MFATVLPRPICVVIRDLWCKIVLILILLLVTNVVSNYVLYNNLASLLISVYLYLFSMVRNIVEREHFPNVSMELKLRIFSYILCTKNSPKRFYERSNSQEIFDLNTIESWKQNIHLYCVKHYRLCFDKRSSYALISGEISDSDFSRYRFCNKYCHRYWIEFNIDQYLAS